MAEATRSIEDIAKPFVEFGIYDSEDKFLEDVVREMVKSKIAAYEKIIKRFQAKYKTPFSEFTKKMERRATPEQEDEWMEWESSVNMLNAWKKAAREIGIRARNH